MVYGDLPEFNKMKSLIRTMAGAVMAFRGMKARGIENAAGVPPTTLTRLMKPDTGAGYETVQKLHAYLVPEFTKIQDETGIQISFN